MSVATLSAQKIVKALDEGVKPPVLSVQTLAMQRESFAVRGEDPRDTMQLVPDLMQLVPDLRHFFIVAADRFIVAADRFIVATERFIVAKERFIMLRDGGFVLCLHFEHKLHCLFDVHSIPVPAGAIPAFRSASAREIVARSRLDTLHYPCFLRVSRMERFGRRVWVPQPA
ncbi:MAG: hypothetical protein ACRD3O_19850 [Terriglobia bacterium]